MRAKEQVNAVPRYTVIPRTLVFLTRGETLLLLRGAPQKRLWANQYNGLGGHIEPGETPSMAARREVEEEAGLAVTALDLRAIIHVTLPEPPGVMLFVFVGEAPAGEVRPSEEGTPTWAPRADLSTLPLVEDLHTLLPRILDTKRLHFGEYEFTSDGALHIRFEA